MARQTRTRRTESGFSVFRISLIAAGAGVVFIVGAIIFTAFDQAVQRQPLNIDPPAGAELRQTIEGVGTTRTLVYAAAETTPELIADYYNTKMRDFYGADATDAERCKRIPGSGTYDNYREGNGVVPYQFVCLFDTATFGAERYTQITIQPGVRNDAAGVNNEGVVRIEYYQYWQP